MSQNSAIEWTENTWNPLTGCTKISPGCAHCYAERMALRLSAMGQKNYNNGFDLTLHPHLLDAPLKWKKPVRIFVNSMSDLFHEKVPLDFIMSVFDTMKRAHWHTFQVLTKRSERLVQINEKLEWPSNVWMGVSVENSDYTYRIDHLRNTGARVKCISFEPLLGLVEKVSLERIDWVIVGGESGPGARHMENAWVEGIHTRCLRWNVPFFFKQWGGARKNRTGRILKGRTWDEYPA